MSDKNLNPFILFQNWFESASEKEINDPNAMCLSTVDNNNCPHSRMVLLKGYDESGFRFFTNYESNKSIDIEQNKNVSLNFHWKSLQRQIRIEGLIDKLNSNESDKYYNSRHYMSRIGAWASDQSRPLKNREELEEKIEMYKKKYPDENNVPRPPHWGGFVIKPIKFEFWQDMPFRLHDRVEFKKTKKGWESRNLYP